MSTPADGTIYVVSVSGDKFADQALRDYAEVGFADTSTYQTIEIDDIENRLTYRAWSDSGEVVDRLEISKPRPQGRASAHPDLVRSDRPGPR